MLVELGNPTPVHVRPGDGVTPDPVTGRLDLRREPLPGPAVTYVEIPPTYSFTPGADPRELALHMARNPDITRLPDHEAILPFIHASGLWPHHRGDSGNPSWVHCDDEPDLARFLSEFWDIPEGRPADIEATHFTRNGMPGVGPTFDAQMLKTNIGNDIQAAQMGLGGLVYGQTGTATAISTTSLTGGTESPGGSHAVNDAAGLIIVAWSNGAWGLIKSNTTGTSPVYTIDRWYTEGTPGGAAATTPGSTTGYSVLPASPPAIFMGLSTNSSVVNATDTTLPSEITTAGGGLIRKICPLAHTVSAANYTLTPVFTVNGSDTGLPVTIAKIGVSQSLTSGVNNLFQTLLGTTAVLSLSGDQLTITETVTL